MNTTEQNDSTSRNAIERRNFNSFLIIWIAQCIARIGNGLTAFGLGVYLYQRTGLATPVAMIALASFLPSILLAPLAGVLADRFDRRLLMILGDSTSVVGLILLLISLHAEAPTAVLCACVALSSICNSVMDPAYRATVTDLLTPDQYARAGGLVQLASASQYLISPVIAGYLMSISNVQLIVTIDICTMVTTVSSMVLVWRRIHTTPTQTHDSFWEEFRQGVRFLAGQRGIITFLGVITMVTFCLGFIQTLFTPLILELSDERTLGIINSTAASGMLVSAGIIGALNMGNNHLKYLAWGMALGGIAITMLGTTTNLLFLGIFAFAFFLTMPPINTSLEVLMRTAIPNETQGRIWGLISLISQIGYIIAYILAGPLADHVFNPLLTPDGALAPTLGPWIGVGNSRGVALMFIILGLGILIIGTTIPRIQGARQLQRHYESTLTEEPNNAPSND